MIYKSVYEMDKKEKREYIKSKAQKITELKNKRLFTMLKILENN